MLNKTAAYNAKNDFLDINGSITALFKNQPGIRQISGPHTLKLLQHISASEF